MVNFFLGFIAPFLIVALWMLLGELLSRNLEIHCHRCGKIFGILSSDAEELGVKPTLTYVTKFKAKRHKRSCK